MKDKLTDLIFDFFNKSGIDPIYGSMGIAVLVGIWLLYDLKNWEEKESWQKFINVMISLGILAIFILFLLRTFGII